MNKIEKVENKEKLFSYKDFEDLIKLLQDEKEEIINLKNEIIEIKEFILEEKELKDNNNKEELEKEDIELKELEKKEIELFEINEDRHNELIDALSLSPEYIDYKEELTVLNNNLVEGYSSFIIFIGFVIAILLSVFFMKGVFEFE